MVTTSVCNDTDIDDDRLYGEPNDGGAQGEALDQLDLSAQ